jgi:prolyl-tRNA editing enzyme YbaK/EbsC (Cys-tRNA(Pro) deacylase)
MKLSQAKKDKISEQILSHLYHVFPQSRFTAEIARELARDEEFIKALMLELQKKNLVAAVKKNPEGIDYERRIKWRLSNNTYSAYKSL